VDKFFTIIAFPRSGTLFTARLLCTNGIPCTHEYENPISNREPAPATLNLVSWCPYDWDKWFRHNQGPMVHLIRHPHNVVKSWPCLEMGVRQVLKEYTGYYDFDNIYRCWNNILAEKADCTFKVEEIMDRWDEFMDAIGYDEPLKWLLEPDANTLNYAKFYNTWLSELDPKEFGY